ncbi:hypothetical protein PRIPAC_86486 [Pristionchus pacificus]|uniref:Uncharacterized protein n=1 Tax=Pristionchus pacificus TaxID=54126 RepID=A0A2A6BLX1_PRIPA|nr:hypothetical protein PRIPAC_86486 [Pristionchus pacificus]|eukprot:PDM66905.1 hypothetical protein PRIPAC_48322 [Pristionchus pacificus]
MAPDCGHYGTCFRTGSVLVPVGYHYGSWFRTGSGLVPSHRNLLLQVLEEHGENLFYLPHGLSIDGEGYIWVTDVGSHQV